jgi:hypothetical protein
MNLNYNYLLNKNSYVLDNEYIRCFNQLICTLHQACLELFYISLKAFFALQINIWTGLTGFWSIIYTVKCCFLPKK